MAPPERGAREIEPSAMGSSYAVAAAGGGGGEDTPTQFTHFTKPPTSRQMPPPPPPPPPLPPLTCSVPVSPHAPPPVYVSSPSSHKEHRAHTVVTATRASYVERIQERTYERTSEWTRATLVIGRGEPIGTADLVVAHVVGTLESNGVEFENTYERGTALSFTMGVRPPGICEGLEEGISSMRMGGTRLIAAGDVTSRHLHFFFTRFVYSPLSTKRKEECALTRSLYYWIRAV